ncbi:NADPH-dependent FMN reductase [Amorphus coralli]|uniref:NADPH-dependent FMN reductase n=1 Tax=Amorphus coralli TaxID=340680 RepID=UPI0003FCABEC|nr:NAD(P)H-dependent oxidoreductase [Amorphus coralli]
MLYPVIYGSVRSERQGIRAARYICNEIGKRGDEAHLVDPVELDLPLLDKRRGEYEEGQAPEAMEKLGQLIERADGFVMVTGEYNHSIPPALKNTLDHYLPEWYFRPAAIMSYSAGRYGGVRAAVQLRPILGELGMVSISSIFAVPRVSKAFTETGEPQEDYLADEAGRFLDELDWWARAAKAQKAAAGTPF